MNKPFYSFEELILEGGYAYTFESVGKQGSITKLVWFSDNFSGEVFGKDTKHG